MTKKRDHIAPDGMIPENLTPDQVRIKAMELAEMCAEIDAKRAAAAADASSARKKIRALEKQRRLLADSVRTGTIQVDAQLKFGVVDGDKARRRQSLSDNGNVDA